MYTYSLSIILYLTNQSLFTRELLILLIYNARTVEHLYKII